MYDKIHKGKQDIWRTSIRKLEQKQKQRDPTLPFH